MIGPGIGGLALAVGSGILLLRWLAGRPAYHRLVQRQVAPSEDASTARRIAKALGRSLVGPESSIVVSWRRHGAPPDALLDRAVRHLGEVRTLFAHLKVVAFGAFTLAAGIVIAERSPRRIVRAGGWSALVLASLGIVAATGAFSRVFQQYHDRAYDNDDWQLPDDALLARLYPERFYQLAATGWFALWGLAGLAMLVADRFVLKRLKVEGQPSTFNLQPARCRCR